MPTLLVVCGGPVGQEGRGQAVFPPESPSRRSAAWSPAEALSVGAAPTREHVHRDFWASNQVQCGRKHWSRLKSVALCDMSHSQLRRTWKIPLTFSGYHVVFEKFLTHTSADPETARTQGRLEMSGALSGHLLF